LLQGEAMCHRIWIGRRLIWLWILVGSLVQGCFCLFGFIFDFHVGQ